MAKSRFPVLHETRLKELMDESKLSQKMNKAETEQVSCVLYLMKTMLLSCKDSCTHTHTQAVNFLHESGVLLHYCDQQTQLSKLYFLDPEWLCMLMAQIISVKQMTFITRDGVCVM